MKRWEYLILWCASSKGNFASGKTIYMTPQGIQSVATEGSGGFFRQSRTIAEGIFTQMARLGVEGWELVSVATQDDYGMFTFKREMPT